MMAIMFKNSEKEKRVLLEKIKELEKAHETKEDTNSSQIS